MIMRFFAGIKHSCMLPLMALGDEWSLSSYKHKLKSFDGVNLVISSLELWNFNWNCLPSLKIKLLMRAKIEKKLKSIIPSEDYVIFNSMR